LDNLSAVNAFYAWVASRYGVANPVQRRQLRSPVAGHGTPFDATPHVVRDQDVKWLDPGGYRAGTGIGGMSGFAGWIASAGRYPDGWAATASETARSPMACTAPGCG
jgi:hypothetical protein